MEENKNSSQHITTKSFKFKYVAEEELLRIVRKVRREKQKEKDEIVWKRHIENKEKIHRTEAVQDGTKEVLSTPSCNEICSPNIEHILKTSLQTDVGLSAPSEVEEPQVPSKRSLPIEGGMTARESGCLQRIAILRHRISLTLDSITGMVQCQPVEPDGPDDFERRRTRINEFLSRFSRNYLFQFQRQVAELRRHIASASLETPGRHTEHQALMQKLVSAHQTAVQSLQAYLTQIPASLQGTNIFGKLKDLLYHLCDLSSLKNQLDVHAGVIRARENIEDNDGVSAKCKELLGFLEEKRTDLEDIALSARASTPHSTKGSCHPRGQQPQRTNAVVHHTSWKKSSAYLARAKFGAPSSVRSSIRSHVSSSRDHRSLEEKLPKSSQGCCNSELRDIIVHMHDVLCKKETSKHKKKNIRHSKSADNRSLLIKKKTGSSEKPLTQVQNLSKNVQLVITKHCDSESEQEGCKDVATDTADFEGESRKTKKVGWAAGETVIHKDLNEKGVSNIRNSQSTPVESSIHEEMVCSSPRFKREPDQRILSYRRRFHEYNAKVQDPMIQKCCDDILDAVFQDISRELEPSFLLERMYHLEFKDP